MLVRGHKLGKYTIRRLIGRGRKSEVYRALHPDLRRDVAIKVFYPDVAKTRDTAICFRRIAQAVTALKHPNIIRVFDYDATLTVHYLVMELIDGTSLRDVISAHPTGLPREDILRYFTQIASAVAYAHDAGLIHGNIKPNNILIDTSRRPVLTDFHVACLAEVDPAGMLDSFLPSYLSPEQINSQPPTPQSDIYALGILLYEMVTGDVPFKGSSRESVLAQHLETAPTPPSRLTMALNPRIENAALKALSKNPADRYTSARDMLYDLESREEIDLYETNNIDRETAQEVRRRRSEIRRFQRSRIDDQGDEGLLRSNSYFLVIVATLVLVILVVLVISLFL